MTKNPKRMSETAAILRQINVNDVNNDLNIDVEEQWNLRSCKPCMHPGIVDQTDNGLSVEEEWNILIIEQSDEEDEDSYDGDRFDNINEVNSKVRAQCAAVFEVEDAIAKWPESEATSNLRGRDASKLYALIDLCLAFKCLIHLT